MLKDSLVVIAPAFTRRHYQSSLNFPNYDLIPPEPGYAKSTGMTLAANTIPVGGRAVMQPRASWGTLIRVQDDLTKTMTRSRAMLRLRVSIFGTPRLNTLP